MSLSVLVVIEQPSILSVFNNNEANPGFGGTSYTALRLAFELHSKFYQSRKLSICIGVNGTPPRHDLPFSVLSLSDISESHFDIVLLTGGAFEQFSNGYFRTSYSRLICWSRHPFDLSKINLAKKFNAELVSVGEYQYLSNHLLFGYHNYIQNIFSSERVISASSKEPATTTELTIFL